MILWSPKIVVCTKRGEYYEETYVRRRRYLWSDDGGDRGRLKSARVKQDGSRKGA